MRSAAPAGKSANAVYAPRMQAALRFARARSALTTVSSFRQRKIEPGRAFSCEAPVLADKPPDEDDLGSRVCRTRIAGLRRGRDCCACRQPGDDPQADPGKLGSDRTEALRQF